MMPTTLCVQYRTALYGYGIDVIIFTAFANTFSVKC